MSHHENSALAGECRETEIGFPAQAPVASRELTRSEQEKIETRLRELDSSVRRENEALVKRGGVKLPGFLFSTTFILLAVALAGVFTLFVLVQVMSFLEMLSAYPAVARHLGYGALAVLMLALFLAGLRLVFAYMRLSRSRQISIEALNALAARQELREMAEKELALARDRLTDYLVKFPLEGDAARAELMGLGFTEDEIEALREHAKVLLDRDATPGASEWLSLFRSGFQTTLDGCARRRVRYHALRVGVKTAIIPIAVIDTVVATYTSFMMIGDLCRVYNLRMGWLATAVVLARAFVNAYLAAEIEEVSEKVFDTFLDSEEFFSQLAGAVAPKLVEGKANAFLLYRLGRASSALLRPVRPD